jgi:hypothetical protein
MHKRPRVTVREFLNGLRAINYRHLAVIVVLSEIFTAIMNTIMGILWWGTISYDLIMIGTIDAFVVSLLVGTIILYIIKRLHEAEEKYRELV